MPRTTLPADAASAAAARRFVADVLWQRGFSPDGIYNAVLLTSEAITNALVHAGTPIDVVVVADALMARIEVHDAHAGVPVVRRLPADASAGRGLHVIQAVAEAWGVDRCGDTKCIWFEVRP